MFHIFQKNIYTMHEEVIIQQKPCFHLLETWYLRLSYRVLGIDGWVMVLVYCFI